jgi:hypothetical protein
MRHLIVLLGLALIAPSVCAQSSATYQIPRSSIDAGAATASSASYQLNSSVGQADAQRASSASYQLSGGFHVAIASGPQPDPIFRDGFE